MELERSRQGQGPREFLRELVKLSLDRLELLVLEEQQIPLPDQPAPDLGRARGDPIAALVDQPEPVQQERVARADLRGGGYCLLDRERATGLVGEMRPGDVVVDEVVRFPDDVQI